MSTFRLSKLFLITVVLLVLFLSSCNERTPAPLEPDLSTAETSTVEPFPSSDHFSDTEIKIFEEIFDKEISQISEQNLLSITRLNIVGNHVSVAPYRLSFSKDGYAYKEKLCPYGEDYGTSLSILKYFPNLKYLGIYFCESLNDISFLETLSNLEELTVVMTGVTDFSVLQHLDELSTLRIQCSPVDTIALSDSNTLKSLYITNSNIASLAPFEHLSNLEEFSLTFNRVEISDTDALCSLKNLRLLQLIAPYYDLSFIENLDAPSLSMLTLGGYDHLDLSKISAVSRNLSLFYLKHSNYTDLTPLDSLPADCTIQVALSEHCTHGERTTDGAPRYSYSSISHDAFDWYYENKNYEN